MTRPEKTIAEFFAGIGLMRIGLENAGWSIAFANDIDEDKWQMYKDHFGDTGEFIVRDIHQLKPSEVPTVGLATASFPCNECVSYGTVFRRIRNGKSMAELRTDGIAGCEAQQGRYHLS